MSERPEGWRSGSSQIVGGERTARGVDLWLIAGGWPILRSISSVIHVWPLPAPHRATLRMDVCLGARNDGLAEPSPEFERTADRPMTDVMNPPTQPPTFEANAASVRATPRPARAARADDADAIIIGVGAGRRPQEHTPPDGRRRQRPRRCRRVRRHRRRRDEQRCRDRDAIERGRREFDDCGGQSDRRARRAGDAVDRVDPRFRGPDRHVRTDRGGSGRRYGIRAHRGRLHRHQQPRGRGSDRHHRRFQ